MYPIRLIAFALAAVVVAGCSASGEKAEAGASGKPSPATPSPTTNGVEKMTATQILAETQKAAKQATAVRVKGDVTSEGEQFKFNMRINGSAGATGTLTFQGVTAHITRLGKTLYFKGDARFWKKIGGADAGSAVGAEVVRLLRDKYVKVPMGASDLAEMGAFTDLDVMTTEIFSDIDTAPVTKGTVRTAGGKRAITLVQRGEDGGTLYVSLEGKPYPLRIEPLPTSKDKGLIEFLDYDKPITIAKPPADRTVDLAKMRGR